MVVRPLVPRQSDAGQIAANAMRKGVQYAVR